MATSRDKIVVTGAKGQLGSEIVRSLSGKAETFGFSHEELDVVDYEKVRTTIGAIQPDVVIHCAAWTDVDGCEADHDRAMAVNAGGTVNVLDVGKKCGALIVYFSTDFVFDGRKTTPYTETDAPNPLSTYGISKLTGEMHLSEQSDQYLVIRIPWLYGAAGKNFIYSILKQANSHLTEKAKSGSAEPLRVVSDQIGNPTYTVDVAKQLKIMLTHNLRGTFHVASNGSVSRYDLAREVFDYLNIDVPIEPCTTAELARPAPRPRYSVLENGRLNELGLNRMPHWRESLRTFLDTLPEARR